MAIVVSFLVVTRVNLALAQYKEARGNLSKMLTSTRDLVSATVSSTFCLVISSHMDLLTIVTTIISHDNTHLGYSYER